MADSSAREFKVAKTMVIAIVSKISTLAREIISGFAARCAVVALPHRGATSVCSGAMPRIGAELREISGVGRRKVRDLPHIRRQSRERFLVNPSIKLCYFIFGIVEIACV